MSRLFDKYLISLTNQRIPMPKNWQSSLGLVLTETEQGTLTEEPVPVENTGYKFQQDDTIDRGYVYSKVSSSHLTDDKLYQLQLYLKALQEHQKKDFMSYFNLTSVTLSNFTYTSKISVLDGDKYTLLGRTSLPVSWRYYSEALNQTFASETIPSLVTPYLIDTSLYQTSSKDDQEYYMLEVVSSSPIVIVNGTVNRFNFSSANPFSTRTVVCSDDNLRALKIPSIINGGRYSDKLIPSLLDIQITEESSLALQQDILLQLADSGRFSVEDAIQFNTVGIYDVDQYIGRNLRW